MSAKHPDFTDVVYADARARDAAKKGLALSEAGDKKRGPRILDGDSAPQHVERTGVNLFSPSSRARNAVPLLLRWIEVARPWQE